MEIIADTPKAVRRHDANQQRFKPIGYFQSSSNKSMKTSILLSLALTALFSVNAQRRSPLRAPGLIPAPVSATWTDDQLVIPANAVIRYSGGAKDMATAFASMLNRRSEYRVTTGAYAKVGGGFSFIIDSTLKIPAEGYRLSITNKGLDLRARSAAGLFYGMQTMLQLLPADLDSTSSVTGKYILKTGSVEDYPRFGWRGLLLDVSRHFFTVAEVKGFIDQMAKYKFNLLHLHLTDDQGWRIEIKSLPKLTSVGAWRVKKTGTFGFFSIPDSAETRDDGGFYTQDQIRDLVQYARSKYINILPEIDIPGHSMAAIAAYPELTCTAAPAGTYVVNSGEKLMEWPPVGHFYGLKDNSLCPANEDVYVFLDKVFTEVAALFPFEYIHMGGDETARNFWEKSEAIKGLMQRENLKSLDEVQSYFVKRVEKIIASKGKKLIGWDEILQGGMAPNAAVMAWQGNGYKPAIEASAEKHVVVMTPQEFVYLDYMQADVSMEPPVYASLRLKKIYAFEPLSAGMDTAYIKGGQGNLWTEQVYNIRQVQYMIWPRAFALAEALWSPAGRKDWPGFVSRVEQQFPRFDAAKVRYARSLYDPSVTVKASDKGALLEVTLENEVEGLTTYYSFDNSFPDQFYPAYHSPLIVPKDASLLRVITYRDGKPIGRMMTLKVEDLAKRSK